MLNNSLKILNISKNQIEIIEPNITSLTKLQSLHIYNNSFTSIPTHFKNLQGLKELSLEWFKYT